MKQRVSHLASDSAHHLCLPVCKMNVTLIFLRNVLLFIYCNLPNDKENILAGLSFMFLRYYFELCVKELFGPHFVCSLVLKIISDCHNLFLESYLVLFG